MSEKAEASGSSIVACSVTTALKTKFPQNISGKPVREVAKTVLENFTDKSFGRQEEVRNATAKVYHGRKLNKYIVKHRVLL